MVSSQPGPAWLDAWAGFTGERGSLSIRALLCGCIPQGQPAVPLLESPTAWLFTGSLLQGEPFFRFLRAQVPPPGPQSPRAPPRLSHRSGMPSLPPHLAGGDGSSEMCGDLPKASRESEARLGIAPRSPESQNPMPEPPDLPSCSPCNPAACLLFGCHHPQPNYHRTRPQTPPTASIALRRDWLWARPQMAPDSPSPTIREGHCPSAFAPCSDNSIDVPDQCWVPFARALPSGFARQHGGRFSSRHTPGHPGSPDTGLARPHGPFPPSLALILRARHTLHSR